MKTSGIGSAAVEVHDLSKMLADQSARLQSVFGGFVSKIRA